MGSRTAMYGAVGIALALVAATIAMFLMAHDQVVFEGWPKPPSQIPVNDEQTPVSSPGGRGAEGPKVPRPFGR